MIFQSFKRSVPKSVLRPPAGRRYVPGECLQQTSWTQTHLVAGEPSLTIKTARRDLSTNRERDFARGLIQREATVCAGVEHAGLVATITVEETDQGLALVQPACISMVDLHGLGVVQKVWAIRQIAEALSALHAAGWLHANMSPDVMVLSREGRATLTELGWCRQLQSDECDLRHTNFAGTIVYSAPELFDEFGTLTTSTDIYSLGAVLYELVAGHPLLCNYAGAQLVAAKRLLSASELTMPTQVPYRLASLLRRMLARDPLRRPTTREVIESLVAAEVESFGRWTTAA